MKDQILIVDDQIKNIYALEAILSQPERELISVTSGNEALKIALNQPIDLVILDVQMPGMDGFEVAQFLKSNKRTRETPIIFVTAEMKDHKNVMKGFEEGALDYLYKPLDPEITQAKVAVLLQLQRQRKELVEKNLILEKYALLINNSADIICIINAETLLLEEVNNAVCDMLGYSPAEIKGTSFLHYIDKEDHARVHELLKDLRETFTFETRMYAKNGRLLYISWNIAHKYGWWFANGRDISKEKRDEQEIRQLNLDLQRNNAQLELTNKELESFSYSVSHDLRAPLRSINGYAQIILDEYGENFSSEVHRLFGVIQKNATKMGVLIDDLLSFSRMGRKELSRLPVDMNKLVESVMGDLNAGQAKITVKELPPAKGDPSLLSQVFINLISNGIKYSAKKENPEVEIGAFGKPDENVYYVKDNGAGFDMTYVNKLFGVFQRLHTSEEFEGTGVGLAIVQRIIVKHGGKVWAEGKTDEGATFYFSLPKPVAN